MQTKLTEVLQLERDTQHGTAEHAPALLRLAGGRLTGNLAEACYDLAHEIEQELQRATGETVFISTDAIDQMDCTVEEFAEMWRKQSGRVVHVPTGVELGMRDVRVLLDGGEVEKDGVTVTFDSPHNYIDQTDANGTD